MKRIRKRFAASIILLAAFVGWTFAVKFIDVRPIGPLGSAVGFAALNGYFHNLIGVNFALYNITDWLGLIPIALCLGFGVLGLIQLIKRKGISRVDRDIIALGGFYIAVISVFLLFESIAINCRPVVINGVLEASYPSSTTLLVMCVMPTALMQLNRRINSKTWRYIISTLIIAFVAFMVIGRLISGVHWITDIIGGMLFSAGSVTLYRAIAF